MPIAPSGRPSSRQFIQGLAKPDVRHIVVKKSQIAILVTTGVQDEMLKLGLDLGFNRAPAVLESEGFHRHILREWSHY